MSDGGQKDSGIPAEGGKTRPKAEVSRNGHPLSFAAKTLGPRPDYSIRGQALRGDDEIVVID